MTVVSEQKLNIIWTERGSSIAGTRITLYDVMDHFRTNRSHHHIAHKLGLTIEQIDFAIAYIETHQEQLETEYQTCLETEKEIRQYWDKHNYDRFAKIVSISPKPEQVVLRAKLTAWNDRIKAAT